MEVKEVPLGDLKPYERNPRDNTASVDYVAESIREFGFKVPIIAEEQAALANPQPSLFEGIKF